jgi:SHS2 domain-containing protein
MKGDLAGFKEVEHTADWQLKVWAPDLPGLLEQAARGMYTLAGTRLSLDAQPRILRSLEISASDPESLLVRFLSELLHVSAQEHQGFNNFQLSIDNNHLKAELSGRMVLSVDKEIKAVTFHNLFVRTTERGLEASIVFDV